MNKFAFHNYIDGLVQDCNNSTANSLDSVTAVLHWAIDVHHPLYSNGRYMQYVMAQGDSDVS